MNPDSPKTPQEELETRLLALLLGELPEAEAAAWRAAIATNPELAKQHDRLKQTVNLVREAAAIPIESKSAQAAPLQLSEQRRKKLLTHFMIPPLKVEDRKPRPKFPIRLVEVLVGLTAIAVLAAMLLPALSKAKSKGRLLSVVTAIPQRRAAEVEEAVRPIAKRIPAEAISGGPLIDQTPPIPNAGLQPVVAAPVTAPVQIVLPAVAELAESGKSTEVTLGRNLQWGVTGRAGGWANNGNAQTAEGASLFAGDSKWSGVLEKPGPQRSENAFAGRYAYIAPAPESAGVPIQEARRGRSTEGLQEALKNSSDVPPVAEQFPASLPPPAGLPTAGLERRGDVGAGVTFATPEQHEFNRRYGLPPSKQNQAVGGGIGGGGGAGFGGGKAEAPNLALGQTVAAGDTVSPPAPALQPAKPEESLPLALTAPVEDNFAKGPQRTVEKRAKLADTNQDDTRALGFDWYLGNALKKDSGKVAQPTTPAVPPVQESLGRKSSSIVLPLLHTAGVVAQNGTAGKDVSALGDADRPAFAATARAAEAGQAIERIPTDSAQSVGPREISVEALAKVTDGRILLETGRVEDAEAKFRDAVKTDPQNPAANYYLRLAQEPRLAKAERGLERDSKKSVAETAQASGERAEELLPAGSVNFAAVDLKQALSIYGELSGKTVLQSTNLPEMPIALKAEHPMTKQEAIYALDGVLASNGIEIVSIGDKFVKAVLRAQANSGKVPPTAYASTNLAFTGKGRQTILGKLDRIRIEPETFQHLGLGEVLQYVSDEARKHDPEKKGVNFIINPDSPIPAVDPTTGLPIVSNEPVDMNTVAVNLNAKGGEVRLADLLDAVTKASEIPIKYSVEDYGVVFSRADTEDSARRKPSANPPIPQPEVQTSENPFSTFSLNVSDVSFKLAAASLEKGQMPDPSSVRSEEFINAFDYRDPEPQAGASIAFMWERARSPFAHNRDLLRFSLKTAAAGRQMGRPLNIVLLLDNSGSMERADRVSIIREALRVLASQLQPQDKLSVITFARTARLVADGISGDQAGEVTEQVGGLTPQGGTNLEDAMNLAYQTAARHYLVNGVNRVVLLTDGAANLGNVEPELLKRKVEAQRKQGIALDCFGIGWEGFNDDLLEVLSRNGDGRYGFINSPEEAATEFAGQLAGALQVAASDVKVQVEFNAKRVTAYRQIGYAKHQLTKEQFRDNTVDAAEIAAQEAGNALYTVEVNPAGDGPLGTVRVRYKIPGTMDYREQAWDVPFTGNAPLLEQSSPAMRLAASASAFSEWLVASPFAAEVTLDRVLGYLSGVPEIYGADTRPKKLEWMIRQAKSLEGK